MANSTAHMNIKNFFLFKSIKNKKEKKVSYVHVNNMYVLFDDSK